jgi:hypothetical protein
MLKGLFKSDEQVADERRAAEEADTELEARGAGALAEIRDTPWAVQQDVRGHWGIHRRTLNLYKGDVGLEGMPTATFPTKDAALAGVMRLANPETILISRDGTPKEQTNV